MGRSGTVALGIAVAVVVAGGTVVALDAAEVLDLPGEWSSTSPAAPSAEPADVEPPPGLSLPAAAALQPILDPVRNQRPDPAALLARLTPVLNDRDLGRHAGVIVQDLVRDRVVVTTGDRDPYVPASTLKLFTATAALSALGPDHRFNTSVVRTGRSRQPTLVLVGGGDPLLASTAEAADILDFPAGGATVSALATDTVRALRSDRVDRVRVGFDAGLFTGPAAAPSWERDYLPNDVVSPVSALWVDQGRVDPALLDRSADPALAAAEELARALERRGLTVVGSPEAVAAPARSVELATRPGLELDTVVEHVLQVSDNEGAEVLLRHVGLATDRVGSFTGGVAGTRAVLRRLGVPYEEVTTYDGSGLSRDNRVTRGALAQVLQLGADEDRPELRPVTAGLPVAHFTGTLASRFLEPEARAGRGFVRAKTGTLSHVHGLAGTTVTRDGALLGFALLTDRVPLRDTLDSRALLDTLASRLAGCGCRR